MKVLVTGGAGFIGSHIVEALIAAGHTPVVVDNFRTGKRVNIPVGIKVYELDINDPKLAAIFADEKPDALSHQAATTDVRRSVADPVENAEGNIMGTIRVFEAARSSGVGRIVFASTGGALYGNTDIVPTPETSPTAPISPYGIGKLTGELYLRYYANLHGIAATSLRYSNVYGPRQDRKGEGGVVAIFIRELLLPDRQQPVINGDGTQTRDFAFVEDVAAANVRALEDARPGLKIYNVGTGVQTSINDLYDKVRVAASSALEPGRASANPAEILRSALDARLIKKDLGWAPTHDVDAGIKKTIEYFRTEYHL